MVIKHHLKSQLALFSKYMSRKDQPKCGGHLLISLISTKKNREIRSFLLKFKLYTGYTNISTIEIFRSMIFIWIINYWLYEQKGSSRMWGLFPEFHFHVISTEKVKMILFALIILGQQPSQTFRYLLQIMCTH